MDMPAADRPLSGIRVLDFSQFLAGPSCALRLADLGAQVIKVERPAGGDACRQLYVADQACGDDSLLFHTINRNKFSVAADLKNADDLARVKTLIKSADVMVHNFRPGVMERIGLGYGEVAEFNPGLVYGVVSGYGTEGPWRDKPGQDLLVQARSGMAWLSGNDGDDPVPVGLAVSDVLTGAHLVQGVLAALLHRAGSGKGSLIEVNLMSSAMDLQFEQFTGYLNGAAVQPKRSAVNNANVNGTAPYGIYRTADGYIAVAMTAIAVLRELLDCAALEPYVDPTLAFEERDPIKAVLVEHLVTAPTATWLEVLEPAGVWCAEVLQWPELEQNEAFKALDAVQEIGEAGQRVRTTACPIKVNGMRMGCTRGAPALGADTDTFFGTL
ncbi:CaiB/BaiF CoA transferase family protein [Granulosicoccus antarcticus]|nr:CaiB/BaiF CoA-transferase family protein [Granulosicoccus antarcticus]